MNRKDFPLLKKYIYLDTAGSSLKPKKVIKAINDFYLNYPINNHNIDSPLGFKVDELVNKTRQQVANLIDATSEQIIFTSGSTDSLNKIALMLEPFINPGDEILLSPYNHDSNIVPWLELCNKKKCQIKFSDNLIDAINSQTKIISYAQQNNTLQRYIDRKQLFTKAQKFNAILINDCAQAIAHQKVSLNESHVIVFSGNKLFGPTGIGILGIDKKLLTKLHPIVFGGGAINQINGLQWIPKEGVAKFEPGTLNLAGIIGLGAAIEYFNKYKHQNQEIVIAKYAYEKLKEIPGIKIYSRQGDINILFNIKNYAPQDVVNYLANRKIIVRAGSHCSHLLDQVIDAHSTIRISIGPYNNKNDIDKIYKVLLKGGNFLDIK